MFEGSEKKLEIIFSPASTPLTHKTESFWKKICDKANTQIVSYLSNSYCHSYILSESSLFIWDHRLLILTCGRTSLANALLKIIKQWSPSDIDFLFYQRKNELAPHHQKTSFMDDVQKISKKIQGQAHCFGNLDEHHFHLFHSTSTREIKLPDQTIEVLMYNVDEQIKNFFLKEPSPHSVREYLNLNHIIENAQIDDHIFQPVGYSLNGIKGKDQYFTIHVTPQEPGFYISFETNFRDKSANNIVEQIVDIFKPMSFDIVIFSYQTQINSLTFPAFNCSAYFKQHLDCGYDVLFYNFFRPLEYPLPAYPVTLEKGN